MDLWRAEIMALRLIEISLHKDKQQAVEGLISGRKEVLDLTIQPAMGFWKIPIQGDWKTRFSTDMIIIRMLVQAEGSQNLLDLLEEAFAEEDDFRINIFALEASFPSISDKEEIEAVSTNEKEAIHKGRVSREELHDDLEEGAMITNIYISMIVLSSIVAAIGVINNNVAVIIGAMVIAPMLIPNVSLSLATALGDLQLAKSALKTISLGISIAIILSFALGLILPVDPSLQEISSRTSVGLMDIALALASGAAGALAFTSAAPAVLIGVAVAVALMPPLVVFGLLLGAGYYSLALGALLLFLANLISVNLAGVVTFLVQGIEPRTWWEAKKAKEATVLAIVGWAILLVILIMIVLIGGSQNP
jgi:uncharacterized hydrophobic protein (TIGR00341 family)